MSIVDLDRVDALGRGDNANTLKMMLADHLDWEHEDIHLEILQDKINSYLRYIEAKEYVEDYGDEISRFIIDIYFKEAITKKCLEFINAASAQLNPSEIYINMHFE